MVLGGRDVTGLPAERRFPEVGLVGQDPGRHLLTERVDDEVGFALSRLGLTAAERRARLAEALEQHGLTALAGRHPLELSVGQRERVALAAILAARPSVIALDEPTRDGPGPQGGARPHPPGPGRGGRGGDRGDARRRLRPGRRRRRAGDGRRVGAPRRPGARARGSGAVSASTTVLVVLALALAVAIVALERGRDGTKELALVAVLGAVAAAGRVFSPLPGVQPVTTTCIVAGAASARAPAWRWGRSPA